ncbi:MAG: family hydrolase, partial [Bacillota bacterium]|nr:family hydrolase [Bacillota bacterium]
LTDRLEDLNALYQYLPEHLKLTIHDPNVEGVYLCEIAIKTISKASGIQKILSRYGVHQNQTICYGDSMNDIEMVQFCGTGICMVSGSSALLAIADDFAEPVADDGIYKSFLKYGLIG